MTRYRFWMWLANVFGRWEVACRCLGMRSGWVGYCRGGGPVSVTGIEIPEGKR